MFDNLVGTYACHRIGTDVYAYKVVSNPTPNRIIVTRLEGYQYVDGYATKFAEVGSGFITLSWRKRTNRWAEVGQSSKYSIWSVGLDKPKAYLDPSF